VRTRVSAWRTVSCAAGMLLVAAAMLAGAALSSTPALAAVSALVVEQASGRTISAVNADTPRYPASLTKMMTLYLLFDALDRGRVRMNSPLRVSRYAASRPPSRLGLRPGQTITVRAAILALATKSANDVAVVVAENLAGNEAAFARQMTAKAQSLGMRRTIFRNASGLHHPQQRTTARDMAQLGRALLRDHPQQYRIFATRSFRWGRAHHANHNRLMNSYRGMDGIKTGYTGPAGYNLVASASRKGRRLVGVVMGSRSSAVRNALMASLLDQGFRTQPGALAVARSKQTRARTQTVASQPQRAAVRKQAKSRQAGAADRTTVQKKSPSSKPVVARARRDARGA
jgi:D-alanyl-D-alanine carboxypeptidase